MTVGGRTIRAIACPIGIDAKEFIEGGNSAEARRTYRQVEASAAGRSLLIGVDRLDYSKGLEERFIGYARFLETRPEARKQVYLLQIAPPSRRRWKVTNESALASTSFRGESMAISRT